jgi:hypothetical protein
VRPSMIETAYFAAALAAGAIGLFLVAVVLEVWNTSRAGPRCGRLVAFALRLTVPVWAFVSSLSMFLTIWFVGLALFFQLLIQLKASEVVKFLVAAFGFLSGIGIAIVVVATCTRLTMRRLDAWLTRDTADD